MCVSVRITMHVKGRRSSEVVIRGDVISHLPLIITVALTDKLSGVIFKLHRINSLEKCTSLKTTHVHLF